MGRTAKGASAHISPINVTTFTYEVVALKYDVKLGWLELTNPHKVNDDEEADVDFLSTSNPVQYLHCSAQNMHDYCVPGYP